MTQFFFKYSDFHFFFKHSSCLKFHFPISIPDLLQVNLANSVLAKVQRYLLYSIPVYFELPIFSAATQSQVFYSATPPPSFLPYQKIFHLFLEWRFLKALLHIQSGWFILQLKNPHHLCKHGLENCLYSVSDVTHEIFLHLFNTSRKNMPANSNT